MPVPPKVVIPTTVATTATADKRTPLIPPLSLTLCYSSIAIHFIVHIQKKDNSCDSRGVVFVSHIEWKGSQVHLWLNFRLNIFFPSSFASMPALRISVWSRSARGVQTGLRMLKVRAQPFSTGPKGNAQIIWKEMRQSRLVSLCSP